MHVTLHLAERAFALHLLLQGLKRLVDIVVADENLNQGSLSFGCPPHACAAGRSKTNNSCARKETLPERGGRDSRG